MPGLLDLKTDLKSLKYGQDRPGGGDSGQPYIKTDINTVDSGFNKFRLTKFDDGLIGGGVIGALNASVTDTLRITKFLTDAPQGPLFIIKQIGLQLSNPRLESKQLKIDRATSGGGFLNNAINFVANIAGKIENAVGPTRIYNLGINTLAQVPVNALGGHIVRHGFLPTRDESKDYINVVTENNFVNGTNRLTKLTNKFYLGRQAVSQQRTQSTNTLLAAFGAITSPILGVAAGLGIKQGQSSIDSYIGGPDSTYGLVATNIRRFDYSQDTAKIKEAFDNSKDFHGKTRDDKNQPSEVKIKNTVDYKISSITGSSFTTSSFNLSSTQLDNSFIYNVASDKDKHDINTTNQASSYNDATQKVQKGFFYGVSTYSSSKYSPSGSNLTDKSGINNSLDAKTAQDSDRHGINTTRQANSYVEANAKAMDVPLTNFVGASYYSSSLFYFSGSSLVDDSGISNNLNYRIASNYDKQHIRNKNLPAIENTNDLVPQGPSSYPSSLGTTGLNSLSLPDLIYGVGSSVYTNIKKATDKLTAPNNLGIYASILSANQLSANPNGVLPKSTNNPTYKNKYGDVVKLSIPWNKATRELRVGSGRRDSLNLTPIFEDAAGSIEDTPGKDIPGLLKIPNADVQTINDLVKFRIQAIDTDNPTRAKWMIFRAYLTDLSDDVNATWNEIKYAGRGDQFYIYNGFTRKMSVSFKVAALSRQEMEPMYQKLNYLMSNLMPDYGGDENKLLMRGPLMRMTIGNWIDGQLCKLDSLSYKIPQDSPWEIGLNDEELILPHIVEVTLGFTPIGSQTRKLNELPRKEECVSNIAQNWNGGEAGEREYIVPCDDTAPTPPTPPIPPPPPPPPTPPTPPPGPTPGPEPLPKYVPLKLDFPPPPSDYTGTGNTFERANPKYDPYKQSSAKFGGFRGGPGNKNLSGGSGASGPFY